MSRKIHVIVACSALVLFATAAAQAREIPINQRLTGDSLNAEPSQSITILQHKGAPGAATSRTVVQFGAAGPPAEECAGFEFEGPIVGGSSVVTFADGSQLYLVVTSGFVCGNVSDGARNTSGEASIVGGAGRFEGASGSVSVEITGVALSPTFPSMTGGTGTAIGTIILGE